jgi:hypothetical protein
MSRQLPPKANFDYLKKQAKELRAELSREQPDIQLADAQRLLAREYGFPTWAALKTRLLEKPGLAFDGSWRVNLSKSRQSSANLFRDATIRFCVRNDTVAIADVVVEESGVVERNTNTLTVDGITRPQQYGYAVAARWITPRHLQAALTKDGEPRGHVDYQVDADGRTMTLSTPDSVIVFDRLGG